MFVPETPYWLLAKGRESDARKSLQWLRGWVSEKAVDNEFQEMKRYSLNANKCTPCQKSNIPSCSHHPTFIEKTKELLRKRTLKPFCLVLVFFAFTQFSGMHGMRPYLVQIFETFQLPVDSNWGTVRQIFVSVVWPFGVISALSNQTYQPKYTLSIWNFRSSSDLWVFWPTSLQHLP